MKLKAIILCLLLIPFSAFAEFTDAEKSEVYKWVQFSELTSDALREVANQVREDGHIDRDVKARVLSDIYNAKRRGAFFFAGLSSTPDAADPILPDPLPTREEFLESARFNWDNALAFADSAIRFSAQSPALTAAGEIMREARAVLASFDWTLPYHDPLPPDNPNTPWDETRTVVGPHGHLLKSKQTLTRALRYKGNAFRDLTKLYGRVAVWPSDTSSVSANRQLWRIILDFADMDVWMTQAQAMHVDVMSPEHRLLIEEDAINSSNFRTADFFRALLQVELLFGTNKPGMPPNFRGREFVKGVALRLRNNNFGLLQASVLSVNTLEESQEFIRRWSHLYLRDREDFWGDLDTWAITAFGFFDPLTPPASRF